MSDSDAPSHPRIVIEINSDDETHSSNASEPIPQMLHVRPILRSLSRSHSPDGGPSLPRKKGVLGPDDLSPDAEVTHIRSRSTIAGLGEAYLVKIKRMGWVKVNADVMAQYPELLQEQVFANAFEEDHSRSEEATDDESAAEEAFSQASDASSEEEEQSEQDSDDQHMGRGQRTRKAIKPARRPARAPAEPSRRSTRATRHQAGFVDEEDAIRAMDVDRSASSSESDGDELTPVEARRKPTKSKPLLVVRTKDADDEEEEEDLPLIDHHKLFCNKCHMASADTLMQRYKRKSKTKKRKSRDEESESDIQELGAWIECETCCNAYHYKCLPANVKMDVERAFKAQDQIRPNVATDTSEESDPPVKALRQYRELDIHQTLSLLLCPACARPRGTECSGCHEEHPTALKAKADREESEDVQMTDAPALSHTDSKIDSASSSGTSKAVSLPEPAPAGHLFRCYKCQRAAHYGCLPATPEEDEDSEANIQARAEYYQRDWQCADCDRWQSKVDIILAWKPTGAAETDVLPFDIPRPSVKEPVFAAEYLVKFEEQSYRHVEWVPHAFMVATHPHRLRNFLNKGSEMVDRVRNRDSSEDIDGEGTPAVGINMKAFGTAPNPNAENNIPSDWFTVDRVLDVEYTSGKRAVAGDAEDSLARVSRVFVKWKSLPYSESTWDTFDPEDEDYPSFREAYLRWYRDKDVRVPRMNEAQLQKISLPRGTRDNFKPLNAQPDYVGGPKHLKLMDFQLLGVNWMYCKWWEKQNGVLSDEMGLGKTVQVISTLSVLYKKENSRPFLVVVPNSTIANWQREFETWAPADMRVVAYFGSAASRAVCATHDLFTEGIHPMLRAHVVLVTYESITNDISLFRKVQRYDTLVVDEAQRLKAGSKGHLFQALESLNIGHKFLLTGTPLNNSVSEILNLMYFLDKEKFHDLAAKQQHFEDLTADKVQELQDLLKPYFLRRRKEEVLNLPPLVENIIPVSMRPLQKKFYKSVLTHNLKSIGAMFKGAKQAKTAKVGSLNNILMQLRKICQTPYLMSDDIEPAGLTDDESHNFLVDASSKFHLLAQLLPKLFDKGHRVLIFSQFLGVLDLLARFLEHLHIPFTSLSGNSTQSERQASIDAFNAEDSRLKVFLLSTRAGGVGINLTTADTVIVFDQDFNPMQDLQAISRAHRIGQKKPVVCYKLIVKASCEEKILLSSKKKLALEHVIVSKMSQEDTENADVEATLQFGAKAIFEEGEGESESDIKYSDADIDHLIAKTEADIQVALTATSNKEEPGNKVFSFAKIWEREGSEAAAASEADDNVEEQRSFWDKLLLEQQAEQEEQKRQREANLGRGRRARRQLVDLAQVLENPEGYPKKKKIKTSSDAESDYEAKEESQPESDYETPDADTLKEDTKDLERHRLGVMDGNMPKTAAEIEAQIAKEKRRQENKDIRRKIAKQLQQASKQQPSSPNANVLAMLPAATEMAPLPRTVSPKRTSFASTSAAVPNHAFPAFKTKAKPPPPPRAVPEPVFVAPVKQTLGRLGEKPPPLSPGRDELFARIERKAMRTGDQQIIAKVREAQTLVGPYRMSALNQVVRMVKEHSSREKAILRSPSSTPSTSSRAVIEID